MQMVYPGLQDLMVDREADDGQIILGTWTDEGVLEETPQVIATTPATREGKRVRLHT